MRGHWCHTAMAQVCVSWPWELLSQLLCLLQAGPGFLRWPSQGFIHPGSWKVILQCVSFAAHVLLTLMLSETQCNSHVPVKSTLYLL